MKKTLLASVISLAFAQNTFAENIEIETGEVVVTASRTPQPREAVIADVTVIDQEEIERAGQSSFIELLQMQPGIEISSNGGAGKTSSIFLRGTTATQVVVLIDGLRVSAATAGTTTFENIPLSQIERIEILRGPASSLYGQDAIGGVIQIFTNKGEGKPHLYAGLGYGTYNTKTAEAGVRGKVNDTQFALNVSSSDTDGFSALKTNNPNFNDKDGYRNLAVSGSLSQKIAEGHDLGIQIFSSKGHTNFDSRFNVTDFSDNADISQFSYGIVSHNQFTPMWLCTLKFGEGVDDSKSFQESGNSQFKTKQRQYSWQNDIKLPLGELTLLYDRLEQRVISDTLFEKTKRNTDGFLVGYLANIGDHSVQANLRSDHSAQFGTHNTGNLAYGYSFTPNWQVTTSYGTAFRAPTFNDLYFPPFFGFPSSNPNTKAEKSRNIEASLRYENNQTTASATIFKNKIDDFITLDQNFLPQNVKAKITGISFASAQQWENWHLKGSVDFQSPRNEDTDTLLVRRANRHGNLNLSYEWNNWHFGSELVATSSRYDDADNQNKLAGYALLNLVTDYKINVDWRLQARLNNALDKDYALAFSGNPVTTGFAYNTPGANLFVSLRWEPFSK